MIDYCQIKADIQRPMGLGDVKRGHISYCGIDFYRQPKDYYIGQRGNLRLKIIGEMEPKLIINNSIHKSYTKGINWNDFTLSKINDSIEILSDEFKTNLLDATLIGKIEFAVNLKMHANEVYPYAHRYHNQSVEPMKSRKEVFGSMFDLKSRRIKQYDPARKIEISKEQIPKPNSKTLRCELVTSVSEIRKRKVNLRKVSSIFNPIFIEGMGKELYKTFSRIKYTDGLPLNITAKEFEAYKLLHSISKEEIQLYKKLVSERTLKRKRATYNKLMKRHNTEIDLSKSIANKVHDKWQDLSSN